MRRCETYIMTRQRRCTYSWTTNGGVKEDIYIYVFGTWRCVSFLSSSFSAIISVFCYSEDIWWIRPRERWVAKKFERRFLLLFLSLLFISFSFRIVVQVWVKNFCSLFGLLLPFSIYFICFFCFLFLFNLDISILNVIIVTNSGIIYNYRVLIFV